MITFKFLLLTPFFVTFYVHCVDFQEIIQESFDPDENSYGLLKPKLRTGDERAGENVKPHEPPGKLHAPVQLDLYAKKMDELTENYKNTPIIEYIDSKIISKPFQSIYNFQLSLFQDARTGVNKPFYVLQAQGNSKSNYDTPAYYCPQHEWVNIPVHPEGDQPRLLFTPSFSGCSLAVDRFDDYFKVYHVNGGRENEQYNERRDRDGRLVDHGYGLAGKLEYYDYGYHRQKNERELTENIHGISFMEYSDGAWNIHHQALHSKGAGSVTVHKITEAAAVRKVEVTLTDDLTVVHTDSVPVRNFLTIPKGGIRERLRDIRLRETRMKYLVHCFPRIHTHRGKREVSCHFSEDQLKQFASEWSDPETIKIKSDSFIDFLEHNPDHDMNKQLLQLVSDEKIISKIEGERVADVKKMIEYGDPKYFQMDRRMNALIGDSYKANKIRRGKLVEKSSKYANRLMLMHSLYSLKHSCVDEKQGAGCGIGVGALVWSYTSHPIENYLYKKTAPKLASKIMTASHFLKNVAPTTKAISQLFAKTFSKTILKGGLGVLSSGFDIYDIVINVNALKDCEERKNSNNRCSDQTVRDSVASLVFDGISIVAGVALVSFPVVGLAMTMLTFAAQIIFNGISAVYEYKKYDTDTWEDISIFLASVRMQKGKLAESLDNRQRFVDTRAHQARDFLNAESDNSSIIAYGIGLGYYNDRGESLPSNADIFLNEERDTFSIVSRVQPTPLENMEMICLPSKTVESFERGKPQNVPSARYLCSNAMVLRHKQRKGDTVVLNLELVKEGHIGGSNIWNNNFIIYNSTKNLLVQGGQNVRNTFTIIDPTTRAMIHGGKNSLNIIDFRNAGSSSDATLMMRCTEEQFILNSNSELLTITDNFSDVDSRSYQYVGNSYKIDKIDCFRSDRDRSMIIHSGGGNETNYDKIYDCKIVILSPFTIFEQYDADTNNDATIYVQTNGYTGQNLESKIIANYSKINVVFNDFNLIDDTEMIYRQNEKELVLNLDFKGSKYKITLAPYHVLSGSDSFSMINKYKHHIVPKIPHSIDVNEVVVDTIVRHAKCSNQSNYSVMSNLPDICTDQVIGNRENEGRSTTKLKILTILNIEPVGNLIIGSHGNDLLALNREARFASGLEGNDIYYIDFGLDAMISNFAVDKMLDVILLPELPTTYTINGENMHLNSNGTYLTILNFFTSSDYRHIYFTDKNQLRSFIPMKTSNKILPFIHATPSQQVFVIEKLEDYREVVIEAKRGDLQLYKYKENLLIMRHDNNSLVIEIKNYFVGAKGYQDTKWLLYNDDEFESFILEDAPLTDYEEKIKADYTNYFDEFAVNFNETVLIRRNQSSVGNERIGLLIIDDVMPDNIEAMQNGRNLVFFDKVSKSKVEIQNWDEHVISDVEFKKPPGMIKITGIDRFNLQQIQKIQDLIDAAARNVILQNKFTPFTEVGVKCLVTIGGLIDEKPTYQCIGMDSINEQRYFFEKNCNTKQLEKFNRISSLEEIRNVALKLMNDLHLHAYDYNMTFFCARTINDVIGNHSREYVDAKLYGNLNETSAAFDPLHRTPLHLAVVKGNVETVEYLVQHDANINAVDSNNKTPLYYILMEIQNNCKYKGDFTECINTEKTKRFLRIAEYLCANSATFIKTSEISDPIEEISNILNEREYPKLWEKLDTTINE